MPRFWYLIYADGKIGNEEVGTVKAKATNETPYGWLPCDGRSVLRADYPDLFEKFNTQTYDGTNTLLSRYGSADATHFNLPDYREVALVGSGTNGTDSIATHDAYSLGAFKDDQIQTHQHYINNAITQSGQPGQQATTLQMGAESGAFQVLYADAMPAGQGRNGSTTRGKRKGINYLIKVL